MRKNRRILIISTVGLIYDGITSVIVSYLKAMNREGLDIYVAGTIDVKDSMHRVQCPYCGYKMPIFFRESAECKGMIVPCKGRNCHAFFEVKLKGGKQIK